MNEKTEQPKIIFILGMMPRSGTHFLANLLCQHPDCVKSIIAEDGLLASADFLAMYVNQVSESWRSIGEYEKISHFPFKELLLENIGNGLLHFLRNIRESYIQRKSKSSDPGEMKIPKRIVTKMPQVINVDKFFKLFPNEQLLIIIRDGRTLTESTHKSFADNYEETIRDWTKAARRIFDFEKKQANNKDKFLIVKYEELHTETEKEMRKILEFLKLEPEVYDFEQALNLPVVGSSTFKRGDGNVHWVPVKKTEEFDPLARAAGWSRAQHERFNYLAKDEMRRLGYDPKDFDGNEYYWKIWNQYHDLLWEAKIWRQRFSRIPKFLKKRYKIYFNK